MTQTNFSEIVSKLEMSQHPEGGFFVETWRSAESTNISGRGLRHLGTSIYFLMPHGKVSKFHRLSSDEIWHFHQGDEISVILLHSNGTIEKRIVGPIGQKNAIPQAIIPKNTWFGATHEQPPCHGYTLVGCTVSPGFEFSDFELGDRKSLLEEFSRAHQSTRDWIEKLT
jgi:predicted cupin superfamily sugar epimerase